MRPIRPVVAVTLLLLGFACQPTPKPTPPIASGAVPSASTTSVASVSSNAPTTSSASVSASVTVPPPSASCLAALTQLESAADAIAGTKYCQEAKARLAKIRAAPPLVDITLSREVEAHEALVARRRVALERIATRLVPCDL